MGLLRASKPSGSSPKGEPATNTSPSDGLMESQSASGEPSADTTRASAACESVLTSIVSAQLLDVLREAPNDWLDSRPESLSEPIIGRDPDPDWDKTIVNVARNSSLIEIHALAMLLHHPLMPKQP